MYIIFSLVDYLNLKMCDRAIPSCK